ncbi:MAG: aldose epimerase [Opitutae bacterium]|nr:aldose epimerase [Opitutae bacterium]MCD8298783.1 aldose epimerase [Opitutae bacterium]
MSMTNFKKDGREFQQWCVGASTFTACITKGARLMSWTVEAAGARRDVIRWPENANWDDFRSIRGGNPILFPFMGRNFADGKKFFWKNPADGVVRPMPMHGFATDGEFAIAEATENSVRAKFVPDAAAREGYPFDYEFFVVYRFSELSLKCDLVMTNRGAERIPWCVGHHFYFAMPWHAGLSRKDYVLKIDAKKFWHHAADGSLAKADEPKKPISFDDPAICDLIYTKLKTNRVAFGPRNGEENVVIKIGDNETPTPWTTVVTWSESDDSPFYCVEPWMGAPNSTVHGNGLHFVEPGATETFSVEVSLE